MNLEDRLRGGLQWQAEQVKPYDERLTGIRKRGAQRRRRAQATAAGALAAAALVIGGGLVATQGANERSTETIFADPPEILDDRAMLVPGLEENDSVVVASTDDLGEDALPDLITVDGTAIYSRQSNGESTQLAAAGPVRGTSPRVVVNDRVRGYVQFGDHDIYWTPGAVAPAEQVARISSSGAELGFTAQSLIAGDVYLSAGGDPVVVYAIERYRDGEIAQQQVLRRELLSGRTEAIWSMGDGFDAPVEGSIRQVSVGGNWLAVLHENKGESEGEGESRCAVRLFDVASAESAPIAIDGCPGNVFGSISQGGRSFAWVEFGVDGNRLGVVDMPSGEKILDTTIDASLPIGGAVAEIDFDGRFIAVPRRSDVLVVDTVDESNHVFDGIRGPSTISSTSSVVVGDDTLRVPDAERPTDEVCPRVDGSLVTILRPTDDAVSRPRCSRVDSGKRLAFENDGDDAWHVQFAHIDVVIEPGAVYEDIVPLGAFLGPGVHAIFEQPEPADDTAPATDAEVAASDETTGTRALIGSLVWFDPSGRYQVALRSYGPMELGDDFDVANASIGGVLNSEVAAEAVAVGCATTSVGPVSSRVAATVVRKADLPDAAVDRSTAGEVTVAAVEVTAPGITTLSGIGVGDTVQEVVSAYRNRIVVEDSTTREGGIDLIFTPESDEDGQYRLIFVTDGTQVLSYRTGLGAVVNPASGCEAFLDDDGDN